MTCVVRGLMRTYISFPRAGALTRSGMRWPFAIVVANCRDCDDMRRRYRAGDRCRRLERTANIPTAVHRLVPRAVDDPRKARLSVSPHRSPSADGRFTPDAARPRAAHTHLCSATGAGGMSRSAQRLDIPLGCDQTRDVSR